MGPYFNSFRSYRDDRYVHSWPGKVVPARRKGCGKHRNAKAK